MTMAYGGGDWVNVKPAEGGRRLRRVLLSLDALRIICPDAVDALGQGDIAEWERALFPVLVASSDDVPDDAYPVSVGWSHEWHALEVVVHSSEWSPVPLNQMAPIIRVAIDRVVDPKVTGGDCGSS